MTNTEKIIESKIEGLIMKSVLSLIFLLFCCPLYGSNWECEIGTGFYLDQGNYNKFKYSIEFNATRDNNITNQQVRLLYYHETDRDTRQERSKIDLETKFDQNITDRVFGFFVFDGLRDTRAGVVYRLSPGVC